VSRKSPILNQPCPGWQADLPPTNNPISIKARPSPRANSLSSTYLELSRNVSTRRNITLLLGTAQLMTSIIFFTWSTKMLFSNNFFGFDPTMIGLYVGAIIFVIIAPAFLLGAAILPPRDCPIRFNRLRRKVYVYDFKQNWLTFPTRWRVTTHSFDWDDLHAEFWRRRAFTPQGGLIITWGVSIAVVKPDTNVVITRFPLTVCQDEGSSWDYVRTYMQHGPDALPPIEKFNDPNDVPPHNLALRLAPKVKWPAAMDVESRSGPT